ncbi:MAG: PilN domain-containing protein [Ignavibacteriae bacterium]|nr:PilN domain-containing protein [Ignavibacteriota bacterium]
MVWKLDPGRIQRLAGITRILGIDITATRARVVELAKASNFFTKNVGGYKIHAFGTIEFTEEQSVKDKASLFSTFLKQHNIKTKYAVTTLQSTGVKTVRTILPSETEDIDGWIRDNYEQLLKLPLPLQQVSFDYHLLEETNVGVDVNISFVRNSDVQELDTILSSAGIQLLSISAGVEDVVHPFQVFTNVNSLKSIVYAGENTISVFSCHEETYRVLYSQPIHNAGNLREEISTILQELGLEPEQTILVGELLKVQQNDNGKIFQPFSISSEYSLAVGLAIKGFLPELSPVNFLSSIKQEQTTTSVYKTLTHRVVFACSLILFVLLSIPMIATIAIEQKIEDGEEQRALTSPLYAEVAGLQRQVRVLEKQLGIGTKNNVRTEYAKLLHNIASALPDEIVLNKLTVESKNNENTLLIEGSSLSHQQIALFLKQLQSARICNDAQLVRSGYGIQEERFMSVSNDSKSALTFSIRGKSRN